MSRERGSELQAAASDTLCEFDPTVSVHVVRQMYPKSHRVELRLHYAVDFIVSEDIPADVFVRQVRLAYLKLANDVQAQLTTNLDEMGPIK